MQFFAFRHERLEREADRIFAGFEVLRHFMVDVEVVAPFVRVVEQLLAVEVAGDFAAGRVELPIAVDTGFDDDPIVGRGVDLDLAGDVGRLVIRQLAGTLLAVVARNLVTAHAANRHDFRHLRHASVDDRFGRLNVLLHQQRREAQRVADVVEAVAGVVGREVFFGVVVDAHQVADRVAVFGPIEPTERDVAGVGIGRVDAERVGLDPVNNLFSFFGCWLLLVDRRHHVGADVFEHGPPELGIGEHRLVGSEFVERAAAFARPVAVAAIAMRFQDRLDCFTEAVGSSGRLGPECGRPNGPAQQRRHREKSKGTHHRSCRPRIVIRRAGRGTGEGEGLTSRHPFIVVVLAALAHIECKIPRRLVISLVPLWFHDILSP